VRALVFDPFAGISGDMTVAALIDLGLDEAWLCSFVAGLGLGDVEIHIERVNRRGIAAPHVRFAYPPEHAHRHLRHVVEIIDRSTAPALAKERARDAFRRIAEAEARVHGTTIEQVHFHEVGALDAILDVLCVMAGVAELGFDEFRMRPVAVGSGWVDIEHGRYPVPAPATLGILHGLPVTGADLPGECTTPTGAAILAALTGGQAPPPDFAPGRIGFGAGTRNPDSHPNVLRVFEATVAAVGEGAGEDAGADPAAVAGTGDDGAALWLIQADVDDMAPEYVAAAQEALLAAGAADAVVVHLGMKKGRPGLRLEALVTASRLRDAEAVLFTTTSTIGVRRWPVERTVLERSVHETEWRGQTIRWKTVRLPDGSTRSKPEFDDVAAAARALGMTAFSVQTALESEDR
jgi:pyridinium-3,5-bisthiocarboxylic acid mononucleotide nickel chelatase